MKFFNLDLHISVIEDIKTIFSEFNYTVDNWSISSHNWVFGKETKLVEVVNQYTWKHLNKEMCKRFYKRYKNELESYDAFIVTHTPLFSLMFQEFNKPIIVVASTRYEAPFTASYENWNWLNDSLRLMNKSNQLIPIANNLYDKNYCKYFTGFDWKYIPSLCDYTKSNWNPLSNSFLLDSKLLPLRLNNISVIPKKQLGRYNWEDLTKYQGIIVIPYNASCMSVFEYYSASIPLFFPSYKFSLELYKQYREYGVYSELSWHQVFGMKGGSAINFTQNDPNFYECDENMKNWIFYSDWYNEEWMPYITYFDSFKDLEEKIVRVNLYEISAKMKLHNIKRKEKIESLWKEVIDAKILY